MKKIIIAAFFLINYVSAEAQFSRYTIQLKNKLFNSYSTNNPSAFLSQKAIDRRVKYNIAIDSTDLPITQKYIDSIKLAGNVTILNKSKWLNQITILTTDASAINKITNFYFVESVNNIAAKPLKENKKDTLQKNKKIQFKNNITISYTPYSKEQALNNYYNYGLTLNEIKLNNGQFLHNIGMRGQNMLIGVLDAGFYKYNSLPAMDSMNLNNRVIETWDFVNNETSVVEDNSHGMSCLSTIVGNIPNNFIGNSPEASVLLYRSEEGVTEYPIEEFNWVCALERADSAGALVITTSLGYTTFDNASFDHTYSNMNGKTTTAAKGGTFAHRKGMLLFTAMGNEGTNSWKYLSTPADLDSTISVGAVNTSGNIANFSSYGPTSDGRVKPEACTVGWNAYVQNPNNTIGQGNGTSYACPKMAGLGTCLWQAFPELNNYAIRNAIIKSGSIFNNPDDRKGYGIPDMKKAFAILLPQFSKITNYSNNDCAININWQSKDVGSMQYIVERRLTNESNYTVLKNINGSEDILAIHQYEFKDTVKTTLPSTVAVYRIKQVIDTTTAGYTTVNIDSVSFNLNQCIASTEIISLLPNPAQNNCTIKIETPYNIPNLIIRILDIKGNIVSSQKFNKPIGVSLFKLPIYFLEKGIYIVGVYNNDELIENKKLIKQ